jgi:hypothetical protein
MAGDRATSLSGAYMKVTLGTSKVLGPGQYSISGLERRVVDVSEFGVDADIFEFASANGGTISISDATLDPEDAEQNTLRTNCESKIKIPYSVTSGLRLYVNSTSFYTVGTSGHVLVTKAGGVTTDRNGVAKTSFEFQVSGAFMWLTSA